jgi:outer membrane protein assembly factor BamB
MKAARLAAGTALAVVLAAGFVVSFTYDAKASKGAKHAPQFRVDTSWPKPLPSVDGHQWVTGEVGGSCMTADDHVVTVNRGFQTGGLVGQDGTTSVPSPPVVEYDAEGNVARAWGDPTLNADGTVKVLPNGIHGCFVDYQDNVWIAGNGDGVVQKWTRDGKTMLLQIGEKLKCDNFDPTNVTCGNSATPEHPDYQGISKTRLNDPADVAVDPERDPITHQKGNVYIADGYGNHRIVVFDANGKYVRQWGAVGNGDGQFGAPDGGHPHCVVLGTDGLVYTCDRNNSRIEVFDKVGKLQRIIPIDTSAFMPLGNLGTLRACDLTLSPDRHQNWLYDTDLGNDSVWVIDRALGKIAARIGRAGHNAGEFAFAHTVEVDSSGTILYVAETITGRRIQKFVSDGNGDDDN